jgi:hypothetical protein
LSAEYDETLCASHFSALSASLILIVSCWRSLVDLRQGDTCRFAFLLFILMFSKKEVAMAKIVIGSTEITRRSVLAGVAAAGSIPVLAMSACPALAKMSEASVAYQDAPKGDRSCANCALFQAPSSCKTVGGVISPNGWCKIWVKKAG